MKHKLAVFGLVGLATFGLTSFTSEMGKDNQQEPKKTRHIKMTKIENGKKMELDTILTDDEAFIWNGDTIGGKDFTRHLSHSDFKRMGHEKIFADGNKNLNKVMIYRKRGGDPMLRHMSHGENVEVFTESDGDSIGKRIIIQQQINDRNDHLMFMDDSVEMPFPPSPPMPPAPRMRILHANHAGTVIDLNDPDIITYRKKDLKGGREKIEIIRKKSKDSEKMNFNFKIGNDFVMPPMPEAPEFNWQPDSADENMSIIEKEETIDGKKAREIKVEVQNKENK